MPEEKSAYASISKMKTFAPSTCDREYLFAHLLRNLESACIKARRYALSPRKIASILKKNNFDTAGVEAKLTRLYGETGRKHLGLPILHVKA